MPLVSVSAHNLYMLIEEDVVQDWGNSKVGEFQQFIVAWAYTLSPKGVAEFLTPSLEPRPNLYLVGATSADGVHNVLSVQYENMPATDVFFFAPHELAIRRSGDRDNDNPPPLLIAICHKLGLGLHKAMILLLTASTNASLSHRR